MSRNFGLASGVAAALNAVPANTFVQTFTAQASIYPLVNLESIKSTLVYVRAIADKASPYTRAQQQHDCHVQIIIACPPIPGADVTQPNASQQLDEYMIFAEQIADYFKIGMQIGASKASVSSCVLSALYDEEALTKSNLFTTSIDLVFKTL